MHHKPAVIHSQGNLNLYIKNKINNIGSKITANQNLINHDQSYIHNQTPSRSVTISNAIHYEHTYTTTTDRYRSILFGILGARKQYGYHYHEHLNQYKASKTFTLTSSPSALFSAGRSMTINATTIDNTLQNHQQNNSKDTLKPKIIPNTTSFDNLLETHTIDIAIDIPTHDFGLYRLNEAKNSPYLLTSNLPSHAFDSTTFYASNYFLKITGLDKKVKTHTPQTRSTTTQLTTNVTPQSKKEAAQHTINQSKTNPTTKSQQEPPTPTFLYDPFTETNKIDEQIRNITQGKGLFKYTIDKHLQLKQLMDNAKEAHEDLQLTPGITLSYEQIQQLQAPIVWYHEEKIKTPTQEKSVYVPKVYLGPKTISRLQYQHKSTIQADNLHLNLKNDLINTGSILTTNKLTIQANNLNNQFGSIKSTKSDLLCHIHNKIDNIDGSMYGATHTLLQTKIGDINNINTHKRAILGSTTGNLTLLSGNNINNMASTLQGKNAYLKAKNDINLDIKTNTTRFSQEKQQKTYNNRLFSSNQTTQTTLKKTIKTHHDYTQLNVTGNITLDANRDINTTAIQIQNKNGKKPDSITIKAGRDYNDKGVEKITTTSTLTSYSSQKNSLFNSKKNSSHQKTTRTDKQYISSNLQANGHVSIQTGRDTNLVGTQIKAKTAHINAGRHLKAQAGYDEKKIQENKSNNISKSVLFGIIKSHDNRTNQIQTNDQNAVGVNIQTSGTTTIHSKGNTTMEGIQVKAANIDITSKGKLNITIAEEKHSNISENTNDKANATCKLNYKQGRIGLDIA